MRLGYLAHSGGLSGGRQGFNEAEAHAPRIPNKTAGHCNTCLRRFNEAEAHAPRIPPSLQPAVSQSNIAVFSSSDFFIAT